MDFYWGGQRLVMFAPCMCVCVCVIMAQCDKVKWHYNHLPNILSRQGLLKTAAVSGTRSQQQVLQVLLEVGTQASRSAGLPSSVAPVCHLFLRKINAFVTILAQLLCAQWQLMHAHKWLHHLYCQRKPVNLSFEFYFFNRSRLYNCLFVFFFFFSPNSFKTITDSRQHGLQLRSVCEQSRWWTGRGRRGQRVYPTSDVTILTQR